MGEEPSETEMGLTPKDMGIKTEEESQAKSLSGIDLSPEWPQITPDAEYRHRFEGFTPGIDRPIERFSLHLHNFREKMEENGIQK